MIEFEKKLEDMSFTCGECGAAESFYARHICPESAFIAGVPHGQKRRNEWLALIREAVQPVEKTCVWVEDMSGRKHRWWDGSCGECYSQVEAQGWNHCPHCGGRIVRKDGGK